MEKYKFYQDSTLLYNMIFVPFIFYSLSILMIIGSWDNKSFVTFVIVMNIIFSIINILTMRTFMKEIILSIKGISIQKFKKQIRFIPWEEFEDVYIVIRKKSRYIEFKIKDSCKFIIKGEKEYSFVNFNVNKKRLSYLRKLCSNDELKKKLDNIRLSTFRQKFGPDK